MKWTYVAAIAMFSAIALNSEAQTAKTSGVSFGIRAGVNFQNINGKDAAGDKLENKLVPRFQGGITVDVPLADEFYLQPGILYSGKGAKFDGSNGTLNIGYAEIPVNFLFKPTLGTGKMILGVGPYIGFAINGKYKLESGSSSNVKFANSVTVAEAATAYYARRMDAGANLLVGYEMSNRLSLQLNAQLGMAKINPDIEGLSNNKTAYRNTGFGLSVGYRFR